MAAAAVTAVFVPGRKVGMITPAVAGAATATEGGRGGGAARSLVGFRLAGVGDGDRLAGGDERN